MVHATFFETYARAGSPLFVVDAYVLKLDMKVGEILKQVKHHIKDNRSRVVYMTILVKKSRRVSELYSKGPHHEDDTYPQQWYSSGRPSSLPRRILKQGAPCCSRIVQSNKVCRISI